MTDWGVPDWRDKSAYPDVSDWKRTRWIWEVVRRNRDYRKEAMAFLEKLECGFEGDEQYEAWVAYFRRWGYGNKVLDPRKSDYCDSDLLLSPFNGRAISFIKGSAAGQDFLRSRLEPKENEIAILFSLDEPFEMQINSARKVLEKCQVARHGKKLPPYAGQNNISDAKKTLWLKFLRVLDAKNANASLSEIAQGIDNIAITQAGNDDALRAAGKSALKSALRWGQNIREISHSSAIE